MDEYLDSDYAITDALLIPVEKWRVLRSGSLSIGDLETSRKVGSEARNNACLYL